MTKQYLNITDLLNVHHFTDEKVEVEMRKAIGVLIFLSRSTFADSIQVQGFILLWELQGRTHFLAFSIF